MLKLGIWLYLKVGAWLQTERGAWLSSRTWHEAVHVLCSLAQDCDLSLAIGCVLKLGVRLRAQAWHRAAS